VSNQLAAVERWRWDEPEITLSWRETQQPYVSKNIRFFIDSPEDLLSDVSLGNYYFFAIETNAWLDEDSETGTDRVRRWEYRPTGRGTLDFAQLSVEDLEGEVDEIHLKMEDAYAIASNLSYEDLSRTYHIGRAAPENW